MSETYPPLLAVQSLTLRAGARTLVESLTQGFAAGEIWCVAGANGAGKTTLIGALAGLSEPSAGHVEVEGIALAQWPPVRLAQRRALMPQDQLDAFSASVIDTVLLNRYPHLSGWGWKATPTARPRTPRSPRSASKHSPRAMCLRFRAASASA